MNIVSVYLASVKSDWSIGVKVHWKKGLQFDSKDGTRKWKYLVGI